MANEPSRPQHDAASATSGEPAGYGGEEPTLRLPPRGGTDPAVPTRSGDRPRLPWAARDDARPADPPPGDIAASAPASATDERPAHDDAATRLYRPTPPDPAPGTVETAAPRANRAEDPVVGWLVVVDGPGRGHSFELGMGVNAIGRAATQKVGLDFGDQEIHREKHALVVFDPKSRRFFLQGSPDARNLTYLGDDLVLTPVALRGGETIVVGATSLRFVPFCGPDFGWM